MIIWFPNYYLFDFEFESEIIIIKFADILDVYSKYFPNTTRKIARPIVSNYPVKRAYCSKKKLIYNYDSIFNKSNKN